MHTQRSRRALGPAILASTFLGLTLAATGCGPDYPKCDTDSDCHEGEYCVNGQCQQCRSDEDCGPGQACASGACEPIDGYCTSDSDCGAGEECKNNTCSQAAQASLPPEAPDPEPQSCNLQSVYFGYDSSELEGSARDQLSNNAQCIRERGMGKIHLTGLTDPRGTEEYNLALGDRRAKSAKKFLKSLGVDANITYSSMGEEMANGSDESGWARDRRVDFNQK